jgi:hypothetical protein
MGWKTPVAVAVAVAAACAAGAVLGITLGKTPAAPASVPQRTAAAPAAGSGPVLLKVPFDGYSGVRPTTIGYSADAGNIASSIRWVTWGATTATGLGIVGLDNCQPNCAQGTTTYVDVTITLSDPVHRVWHKMTEAIAQMPPKAYTYPGTWALDAH